MELDELSALITGDFDQVRQKLLATKTNASKIADWTKQFNPDQHSITDASLRPDKIITVNENGADVVKSVKVARLLLPLQKKIVGLAAAFLVGNPIELVASPADDNQTNYLSVIRSTWSKNKLDYDSKLLAKIMMSETEVAEIWYGQPAEPDYWANTPNQGRPWRLRMKILANRFGDTLYPIFNNSGDMIAFGRGYFLLVGTTNVEHFDVYTDTTNYLGTKSAGGWDVKPEKNMFGKIPVIYYTQANPEWSDVQTLIDQFEKSLSDHSDTNAYFASPMVKVKGEIKGFASKGDSGKVLELANGADAEYMSWDQSPKSLELEFKNLRSLIFDMTDTPDISIENMKSLGTYSGIALKMIFLGAHLKAADKEEVFGKGIQRRINFIKAAMVVLNNVFAKSSGLDITPHFEYFLPKDDAGIVDMLIAATGGEPIMSQESAVRRNPLVEDADSEIEKINNAAVPVNLTP